MDLYTIVFTKRAKAVSDFDVESAYEKYKNYKYIEISSSLLLNRFKVGVKRKEIPQFNLIVEDSDGKIYEDIVSIDGCLDKCWSSLILSQNLYLTMELI